MTPDKLEKIRRLAEDHRGDPATRAVAMDVLKRYGGDIHRPASSATRPQPASPLHPGMRQSPEYQQFRFMDIGSWRRSAAGNPIFSIAIKGRQYRIVIFPHKKSPTYGWLRTDTYGGRRSSRPEVCHHGTAHGDAWRMLQAL